MGINMETNYLYDLLSYSLKRWKSEENRQNELTELDRKLSGLKNEEWNSIIETARNHSVLSLMCETVEMLKSTSDILTKRTEEHSRSVCQMSYRIFIATRMLINLLAQEGIKTCALKGIATAAEYEVPELRKSGDVDILLADPKQIEKAVELMTKIGFVKDEKQWTLHHVVMTKGKIIVEIHTMLAEPFDNKEINAYMESRMKGISEHFVSDEVFGISFVKLEDSYQAYELLLHMVQHFLNSGFGIKLLCDWVRFWNREHDEKTKNEYLEMVKESGLKTFSNMVTRACIKYLGLSREYVSWMNIYDDKLSREVEEKDTETFMEEIVFSEEFGRQNSERVVAVRGTGVGAYFKELHHQMKNSFPKAGKCFLIWPILWFITAFRFVRNNRKVRGVSTLSVLKSAGGRGSLVEKMKLFEKESKTN